MSGIKDFLKSEYTYWSDMKQDSGRDVVFSFGGGVDSTGIIFEMDRRGWMPGIVIFADTGDFRHEGKGCERPDIYDHVQKVQAWLMKKWDTQLHIVRTSETLYDECIRRETLPALALGYHTCSQKHKIRPIAQWLRDNGYKKIIKIIGYDAGEFDRARRALNSLEAGKNTEEYGIDIKLWFPLIEWGKYREDIKGEINDVGFCASKSSCFFCPAMSLSEVLQLRKHYPGLYQKAIEMERNADLKEIKGLGRSWSWEQEVKNHDMQPELFSQNDFEEMKGIQTCGCINW